MTLEGEEGWKGSRVHRERGRRGDLREKGPVWELCPWESHGAHCSGIWRGGNGLARAKGDDARRGAWPFRRAIVLCHPAAAVVAVGVVARRRFSDIGVPPRPGRVRDGDCPPQLHPPGGWIPAGGSFPPIFPPSPSSTLLRHYSLSFTAAASDRGHLRTATRQAKPCLFPWALFSPSGPPPTVEVTTSADTRGRWVCDLVTT